MRSSFEATLEVRHQLSTAEAVEYLLGLSPEDGVALFQQLDAPAIDQVAGDFDGHIPHYIASDWYQFVRDANLGDWQGKAYTRKSANGFDGEGYNRYIKSGKAAEHLPFAWRMQKSDIDGKPSLVMYYSAFKSWGGKNDLIDELREFRPGVLLGIYHTREPVDRFTPRAGYGRSAMEFFVLTSAAQS